MELYLRLEKYSFEEYSSQRSSMYKGPGVRGTGQSEGTKRKPLRLLEVEECERMV